jgi:hypothetical protein
VTAQHATPGRSSYALGVALAVTPEILPRPTPCRDWDLRMLLRHACESLAAFGEGIEAGRVGLDPAAEDRVLAADPSRAFRDRAGQLLDAWTGPSDRCWAVKKVPGALISSGCDPGPQWSGSRFTCSWVMPRRPSGHLKRGIAARRVRVAAVTGMYQRGRPAPLPGIRVNGDVVKVASGSEPVTCGQ